MTLTGENRETADINLFCTQRLSLYRAVNTPSRECKGPAHFARLLVVCPDIL
jgi:hypothetical protein